MNLTKVGFNGADLSGLKPGDRVLHMGLSTYGRTVEFVEWTGEVGLTGFGVDQREGGAVARFAMLDGYFDGLTDTAVAGELIPFDG